MIDAELRRRMEQAVPQSRPLVVDEIVPEARDVLFDLACPA